MKGEGGERVERRERREVCEMGERDNLFIYKVFHSFLYCYFAQKARYYYNLYVPSEIYKVHSANNSKCIFDLNILNQRAQNSGSLP